MIATMAAALLGAYAVLATATLAYAGGDDHDDDDDDDKCDSTGVPPFKDFPGASGPTGNPHTCEQPTGDPHDDPDNPSEGNPHNTE
jgi:hypothetical protein